MLYNNWAQQVLQQQQQHHLIGIKWQISRTGCLPQIFVQCINVSGADYNLRSSTRQVNGKTMNAWPYLNLEATFFPHLQWGGRQVSSLHHMEETIHTEAINFFSCQPKQKEYKVSWLSTHGAAQFKVLKTIVDMRCAPRTIGDGSMTRRVSKRRR